MAGNTMFPGRWSAQVDEPLVVFLIVLANDLTPLLERKMIQNFYLEMCRRSRTEPKVELPTVRSQKSEIRGQIHKL